MGYADYKMFIGFGWNTIRVSIINMGLCQTHCTQVPDFSRPPGSDLITWARSNRGPGLQKLLYWLRRVYENLLLEKWRGGPQNFDPVPPPPIINIKSLKSFSPSKVTPFNSWPDTNMGWDCLEPWIAKCGWFVTYSIESKTHFHVGLIKGQVHEWSPFLILDKSEINRKSCPGYTIT